VKAFLDSSVLIAAFYANHQFHQPSIDLFLRFKRNEVCCGAHSLVEIYSSLTGRTGRDRVSGDEAMLFLGDVRQRLTIIHLDDRDYFIALEASATLGIRRRRYLRRHARPQRTQGEGAGDLYLEREGLHAPWSGNRGSRESSHVNHPLQSDREKGF
jgi:hypothetical protein